MTIRRELATSLVLASALLALPAGAQGVLERLFGRGQPAAPAATPGGLFIPGFGPIFGHGPGLSTPYVLNRVDKLPVGRQTVVVFVASGCRQCLDAVEDARRTSGAGLEVMDVTSSSMAKDAFNALGSRGLPTTVAGTQMLVGRDANLLRGMLGAAGMSAPEPTGNP